MKRLLWRPWITLMPKTKCSKLLLLLLLLLLPPLDLLYALFFASSPSCQ
jgi:hypothetical protein